jgi:hypothetical protein
MSRTQISADAALPKNTVKISVQRLLEKALIQSSERHYSCKAGGAIYTIPKVVVKTIDNLVTSKCEDPREDTTGHQTDSDQESQPHVVRCTSITTTNTTSSTSTSDVRLQVERFQCTAKRLELSEFKLGTNDILALWRTGAFSTEQDLLESLEHIAFYLRTDDASTIKNPKAWILSTLRQGYYAPPHGFVSWEERQIQERLAAKAARAERLRRLRQQEFDVDFDIWLHELSDDRRNTLLRGIPVDSPDSLIARSVLREAFARETGREDPSTTALSTPSAPA